MLDDFLFDTFFDLKPSSLPPHCEYYFNVLVVIATVPPVMLPEGSVSMDDISKIKDARPIYVYTYVDEDAKKIELEFHPHAVVEVNTRTNEVAWYSNMFDFDTERPWAIEPIMEDFDWEDEDSED